MAFPIPEHLPRRTVPQDVASKILSRIDEAANSTLSAALARSWLEELDQTIRAAKVLRLTHFIPGQLHPGRVT
jgi:protein transport protein DSL1/ZW10